MSPSCLGEPRLKRSPASSKISVSSRAISVPNVPDRRERICLSMAMPRRSMRASVTVIGRSSVANTPVIRSAGKRGFSTSHSRSVTSVSSAEYSVALSIATRAKPIKERPVPATAPNWIGLWPKYFCASTSMPWSVRPASST